MEMQQVMIKKLDDDSLFLPWRVRVVNISAFLRRAALFNPERTNIFSVVQFTATRQFFPLLRTIYSHAISIELNFQEDPRGASYGNSANKGEVFGGCFWSVDIGGHPKVDPGCAGRLTVTQLGVLLEGLHVERIDNLSIKSIVILYCLCLNYQYERFFLMQR